MAADNELDPRKTPDEPKQISRRALLKELSKAPGVMGALMIPGTWVAPLMEFTLVAGNNPCSFTGGSCSGATLSLPFGSTNSVSWSVAWYGLVQGSSVTAVLDPATKKVRLSANSPFSATGLAACAAAPDASVGAQAVNWNTADNAQGISNAAATFKVSSPGGTPGASCSRPVTPDVPVNYSMDLLVTGSQAAGYTLLVKNFHSSSC